MICGYTAISLFLKKVSRHLWAFTEVNETVKQHGDHNHENSVEKSDTRE